MDESGVEKTEIKRKTSKNCKKTVDKKYGVLKRKFVDLSTKNAEHIEESPFIKHYHNIHFFVVAVVLIIMMPMYQKNVIYCEHDMGSTSDQLDLEMHCLNDSTWLNKEGTPIFEYNRTFHIKEIGVFARIFLPMFLFFLNYLVFVLALKGLRMLAERVKTMKFEYLYTKSYNAVETGRQPAGIIISCKPEQTALCFQNLKKSIKSSMLIRVAADLCCTFVSFFYAVSTGYIISTLGFPIDPDYLHQKQNAHETFLTANFPYFISCNVSNYVSSPNIKTTKCFFIINAIYYISYLIMFLWGLFSLVVSFFRFLKTITAVYLFSKNDSNLPNPKITVVILDDIASEGKENLNQNMEKKKY